MHLPNPVIRSHYRNGFIKQYVRDHLILRTEAATNNVTDYGVMGLCSPAGLACLVRLPRRAA